jgi:hypothetical protein
MGTKTTWKMIGKSRKHGKHEGEHMPIGKKNARNKNGPNSSELWEKQTWERWKNRGNIERKQKHLGENGKT